MPLPNKILVRIRRKFTSFATKPEFRGHSVLVGDRSYTYDDGPFEVDSDKAKQLIESGLADAVVQMPVQAAGNMKQAKGETAGAVR